MWVKGVTVLILASLVCGCGQAVSETNSEENILDTKTGNSHPFYNTGQLPNITLDSKMANLEDRVKTDLSRGFLPEAFIGLQNPDTTIFKIGGSGSQQKWDMIGPRRVAHLVIRHLESVVSPSDYPANFCNGGQIYSGYVAARPFTHQEFHATAIQITTVMPYGLFVCETGSKLSYKLAPANSGIFQIAPK